jgi:large subunit ribosomal protein L35
MPKLKSNRGAAKRFRATGRGKVIRSKAFASHKLTHKTTKRKRSLRQGGELSRANRKSIRKLLPYL